VESEGLQMKQFGITYMKKIPLKKIIEELQ
jgi:hypothetical protein